MVPLTRTTRQALATVALIVLTGFPTAYVGYTAWRLNRPGHIRDVEIELGRQLGLQVTVDGVRYPRPGEVLLRGLVLRQTEPRGKGLVEIVRASEARVVRGDHDLTILTNDLQIRGESPSLALGQIASLLQRSATVPFERVNLTSPSCTIELGAENPTYHVQELAGEFVADQANPVIRLAYRMGEPNQPSTRCEVVLNRRRTAEVASTELTFRTVEGPPLPARILDSFFDSASWLGSKARVDGTLVLRQSDGKDCDAEFRGNLLDIDLETLVGRRFPHHRLNGLARLSVQSARWGEFPAQQGRGWVEASGDLTAGQGLIGADLLQAMTRELKFRLPARLARSDSRGGMVEFRKLGLAFGIASDGAISLKGGLGRDFSPNTVLAGLSSPIAFAPEGSASVPGLIKTLFPVAENQSDILVPLTSRSKVLLYLPVPKGLGGKPAPTLEAN